MSVIVLFLAMLVLSYLLLFVASLWNWLGSLLVAALLLTAAITVVEKLFDRLDRIEQKLDAILGMTSAEEEKEEHENA